MFSIPLVYDSLSNRNEIDIGLNETVNLDKLIHNLSIIKLHLKTTFEETMDYVTVHGLQYLIEKNNKTTPIRFIRQAVILARKYERFVQLTIDDDQLPAHRAKENEYRDLLSQVDALYVRLKERNNINGTIDTEFFRDLDRRMINVLRNNFTINNTLSDKIIKKEKEVIELYSKQFGIESFS